MFDIKMTINGKPATGANIRSELQGAVFESVVNAVKEKIAAAITDEEARQITIDVVGNDIKDLSFNVKGPTNIADKIRALLA